MERLGYEFLGEYGLAGRLYFRKGVPREYHVHAVELGGAHWTRHLAFRDYLRRHPSEAEGYAAEKRRAAEAAQGAWETYCDAEGRLRRRPRAPCPGVARGERTRVAIAERAHGEEAAPPVGPRAVVRLLRTREFGPYFVGNALSASGGWFQNLAAAILVYRLTGSEFLLGVLTFANFAPMLVLAPWTGSLADRFDRRRLLLVTQPVSALFAGVLALVTALDLATAPLVICLVLLVGIVSAFSTPAQMALIASLVPPRDLPSAVALNSMTFNIARTAGPALAALTIATIGIAESFAVNSASYLLFTFALLTLRPREQVRAPRDESRLRDSLRLIRREPRLLAYLLIVAAVGFASDPVNTLAPAFADEFGYTDTVAGLIIGVFGAGAVTAAFVVAGRVAGSRRRIDGHARAHGLRHRRLRAFAPARARLRLPLPRRVSATSAEPKLTLVEYWPPMPPNGLSLSLISSLSVPRPRVSTRASQLARRWPACGDQARLSRWPAHARSRGQSSAGPPRLIHVVASLVSGCALIVACSMSVLSSTNLTRPRSSLIRPKAVTAPGMTPRCSISASGLPNETRPEAPIR